MMRAVIISLILPCAAAVWLMISPPEQYLLPGAILLAFVLLTAGAALCVTRKQKKRIGALQKKVLAFLREGKEPTYSLKEDGFAEIENDIAEMARRMLVQQDRTEQDNRKTFDFISDVSHQLKTPLTSLKLYCEMRGECEKELILIEQMETLIYSLIRLQKLAAGVYEMSFSSQDIHALVIEIIRELSPLYPQKKFSVNGNPGTFRFDEYWLGEAIKKRTQKRMRTHRARRAGSCPYGTE